MVPPPVYILLKLQSSTKTKPAYKIAEITPAGWPSDHREDELNNVYVSTVVTHTTARAVEKFDVKIEGPKSGDCIVSIESWSEDRKAVEEKLQQQQIKDLIAVRQRDGKVLKPEWKHGTDGVCGEVMVKLEDWTYVWFDVVEVRIRPLVDYIGGVEQAQYRDASLERGMSVGG
ncbi:hypothetical protein BU26DRAFT_506145 [Trematosphaeria pertusa]|uniref:Uncharacterized protein n=1 Tax=Trematosphaeria pertusa TaxID=390896 RepID=A0A6A6ICX8_9PLEO|nr:uncharacterized protein BU26DRAFT_506145 [Trematosphaeria pertusa]KAF2248435.1 hypothetical protein BU26DRAFT_506145 [Trematosphaeria pertusa]